MKPSSRVWRRLGLGLLGVVVVVIVAGAWIVPAVDSRAIACAIRRPGGVHGLVARPEVGRVAACALHEGPGADSPVWARCGAGRTGPDPRRGSAGRFAPGRIILVRPRITFRLGKDGQPLTRPPLKSGGLGGGAPGARHRGRITIRQEGRPEMVVGPVDARLAKPGGGGELLTAETDDPTWGRWSALGRFDPGFGSGQLTVAAPARVGDGPFPKARPRSATPEKMAMIPFIPAVVWEHIEPAVRSERHPLRGLRHDPPGRDAGGVRRHDAPAPSLGVVAEKRRVDPIDGATVHLGLVRGRAIGGTIGADGATRLRQEARPGSTWT